MHVLLRGLVVSSGLLAVAACGHSIAEPLPSPQTSAAPPLHNELPDSTGSCRSGYIVVHGRCEPAPGGG